MTTDIERFQELSRERSETSRKRGGFGGLRRGSSGGGGKKSSEGEKMGERWRQGGRGGVEG